MKNFYKSVLENIKSTSDLDKLRTLCKKYKPDQIPSKIRLLLASKGELKLKTKPVRVLSGVAPVAIMTKYFACKHGVCTMCPTFPDVAPQSYTKNAPASLRAYRNKFHPYLQVFNRLEQYRLLGHMPDKIELILMGGTFTSIPVSYQNWFIKNAFMAFNDFQKYLDFDKFVEFFELDLENNRDDKEKETRIQNKILDQIKEVPFSKALKQNETSKIRCVTLCIETKADWCTKKEINRMLNQGCTRVELGVQSTSDSVLNRINRGHTVADNIRAIKELKDSGFKVGYHMLLGAPNSDVKQDLEMMKEIFSNPDYKPDALKIYPCMVFKNTPLYNEWKNGLFNPLTTEQSVPLIAEIKRYVPKYCRIMRVQRDMPTYESEAGVNRTNLRQYVHAHMNKQGWKCNCIRCRQPPENFIIKNPKLERLDYEASQGQEIFLSYEQDDKLLGFLRLRIPSKPFRKEISKKTALVRELHIYGNLVNIDNTSKDVQHQGLGRSLMLEAERIAKEEFKMNKMVVISGIGVKEYFRNNLGYKDDGVYVSKFL